MKTTTIIKHDFRRYWWLVVGGLTAIFCVELLALYSPQLIRRAIDLLADGQADSGNLLRIGGGIVALALGVAVLRALGRPSMMALGLIIERDLRESFFSSVMSLNGRTGRQPPTGDIMTRATYDIANIRLASGYGFQAAVNSIVTLVLALVYMISMSPVLTLLAFLPMTAIPWLTSRQSRKFHQCHRSIQESFSALTEESRDSLNAIRLIKVFDLVSAKNRQLEHLAQRHLGRNMELARVTALYLPVMTLISNLSQAVVWGGGGAMAVVGLVSAGDIVAFSAYLVLLKTPLVYSGYLINLYQRARSSCSRIDDILELKPETTQVSLPKVNVPDPGKNTDVIIKNLCFTYPGENKAVLKNIDLRFPYGSTTAMVGPVGSGKSTLLQLLARIHEPPPGTIFINGTDITQLSSDQLRAFIGMAVQDPFLFSDTIRANLLLASPQASDQQLWQALETAGLSEEIRKLPEQLDNVLGEKGMTLSGGQKARLCLARTILQGCPLLLLDDPLSAVDTPVEAKILDNLSRVQAGSTRLIVSHRPQSLAFCDRIVVLEEGHLAAEGSHETLFEESELYRRLVLAQKLESRLGGRNE